ncbi:MAG: enoyl-CoA hydratase/isomerase family protein [Gammaproteobacteria bacterium]|nr:enoyl-CoA hydratase/isomerase family protein [Gammaproteobacteria bacterium]
MSKVMLLSLEGAVATITLNRPEHLNALHPESLELLEQYVGEIEENQSVRVVVLRSTGKAFCAGADLKALPRSETDPGATERFLRRWYRAFNRLAACNKPSIVVIHGMALAGGLELVMCCDLAIATEDARIGDQHANFGLLAGGGGTQRLPRLIGERRAKWLLYSGEWISAKTAEEWGLINAVVPADKVEEKLSEMTGVLASKSPVGLASTKFLVDRGLSVDLDTGLDMEVRIAAKHVYSQDVQIGLDAFLNKKKPEFIGR